MINITKIVIGLLSILISIFSRHLKGETSTNILNELELVSRTILITLTLFD